MRVPESQIGRKASSLIYIIAARMHRDSRSQYYTRRYIFIALRCHDLFALANRTYDGRYRRRTSKINPRPGEFRAERSSFNRARLIDDGSFHRPGERYYENARGRPRECRGESFA